MASAPGPVAVYAAAMAGIQERYEHLLEAGLALAGDLSLPATLQRVGESLRRIHDGPAIPGLFVPFRIVEAYIGAGPHLKEGSPAQNADKIAAPVLMFHGDEDTNVSVEESRLMLSRLKGAGKNAELVVFKGLDHQLDDSAVRAEMLKKSDDFLKASLGL